MLARARVCVALAMVCAVQAQDRLLSFSNDTMAIWAPATQGAKFTLLRPSADACRHAPGMCQASLERFEMVLVFMHTGGGPM